MQKRSQSSIEFTVLISFMFMVFIVFFYVIGSRFSSIRNDNDRLMLEDFGDYLKNEVSLAASAADGYQRTFEIPATLNGRRYNVIVNSFTGIDINHSEMIVSFVNYSFDYSYVVKLPLNVEGDFDQNDSSLVTVKKDGNKVVLSSKIICGDLVCSRGENCLSCPGDCGVCTCINLCNPSGLKNCSLLSNSYQVCGDYEGEPCNEWGIDIACPTGSTCTEGECVCSNDCTADTKACTSSSNYSACVVDFDEDTCYEWGADTACPTGSTCADGECVCSDDCTADTRACVSSTTYHTCVADYDEDPCYEWNTTKSCSTGYSCVSGNCVSCTHSCYPSGTRSCTSSTTYHRCGNYDADPCYEWSSIMSCSSGYTCVSGVCTLPCYDSCSPLGRRACVSSTTYHICGNYDGDTCYEWSYTMSCGSGYVCVSGVCTRS